MRIGRSALVLAVVGVIGVASVGEAQIGGWVGANAIAAIPATSTTTQTATSPCCPTGTFQSTFEYETSTKASFDIGGGVRLFPQFGIGVAFSRYADEQPAGISFSLPHPLFVGRPASASGTSESALKQEENAVHIEVRYVANAPRASVAVFAGPSYFKATRTVITDFEFFENLGLATLNYTVSLGSDTTTTSHDLSAWGFNVGVDAGYYFRENVGVGFLVRYAAATVDLPNTFQSALTGASITQPLDLGGFNIGGGIRFRF